MMSLPASLKFVFGEACVCAELLLKASLPFPYSSCELSSFATLNVTAWCSFRSSLEASFQNSQENLGPLSSSPVVVVRIQTTRWQKRTMWLSESFCEDQVFAGWMLNSAAQCLCILCLVYDYHYCFFTYHYYERGLGPMKKNIIVFIIVMRQKSEF